MPIFRVPRSSGPHRIAAIALHRALLKQCRALDVSKRQSNELQNLVRNRFKQAQHNHSERRLKVSFEAGYEAVDYLDAAVAGSAKSKSYILELLDLAPPKVKQPKTSTVVTTKRESSDESDGEAPFQQNDKRPRISLLARPIPLEKLTGKRHVPVLFNANKIPVLRIKKPQPASLSGYIHNRHQKSQARHDTRHRLDGELALAQHEDDWDRMVAQTPRSEPGWQKSVNEALQDNAAKLKMDNNKNTVMAAKMQAVVDREQALFDQEKREKKQARHNRGTTGQHGVVDQAQTPSDRTAEKKWEIQERNIRTMKRIVLNKHPAVRRQALESAK